MGTTTTQRHPSTYADFTMLDERARNHLLTDRSSANLLVSTRSGEFTGDKVANLAHYVPAGSVVVLNRSGTFLAKNTQAELAGGELGTVHFAQMLEDNQIFWKVIVPEGGNVDDVISLPGGAFLQLKEPVFMPGSVVQASWEHWGQMWIARFDGPDCFEHWSPEHNSTIQYEYDRLAWELSGLQNEYAGRQTSAMMNNGGRNVTMSVLDDLLHNGCEIVFVEMRTGVGVDNEFGLPFPEHVSLDPVAAMVINRAIVDGKQILPVGTGVIRLLDHFYDPTIQRVSAGSGWCKNLITPDNGGTWLNAWISGMHEPKSTHLAMGAAVLGDEDLMRDAMLWAYREGFMFHENGDTHLHLPHA